MTKEELRLATTLIDASTSERFDMAKYEDEYTARLKSLIESKMEEQPTPAAPSEKEPPLINLMDALRRSVAQQSRAKGAARKRERDETNPRPAPHKRQSPGELRYSI